VTKDAKMSAIESDISVVGSVLNHLVLAALVGFQFPFLRGVLDLE
jgi:hypothetical protein